MRAAERLFLDPDAIAHSFVTGQHRIIIKLGKSDNLVAKMQATNRLEAKLFSSPPRTCRQGHAKSKKVENLQNMERKVQKISWTKPREPKQSLPKDPFHT